MDIISCINLSQEDVKKIQDKGSIDQYFEDYLYFCDEIYF